MVVCLCSSWLLRLFYGDRYQDEAGTVQVLALAVLAGTMGMGAEQGLRALAHAGVGFTANVMGLGVTIFATLLLLPSWGILGAAWAFLLGTGVNSLLRSLVLWRLLGGAAAEGGTDAGPCPEGTLPDLPLEEAASR